MTVFAIFEKTTTLLVTHAIQCGFFYYEVDKRTRYLSDTAYYKNYFSYKLQYQYVY